jgi:decaprenylphospho-beta-D-erythro-pentofuranosid-2-ulose 2-reductase
MRRSNRVPMGAGKRVVILGAASTIARALATRLASQGASLLLAGRDLDEIDLTARDLRVRFGVEADSIAFDATDFAAHAKFVMAVDDGDGIDGAIAAYGTMPPLGADRSTAREAIDVNYASVVSLFEALALRFEARGAGFLCAIGSVAGDRGRERNYLYGSTKAALATYLDGLRVRTAKRGVSVIGVKPGFVDTALTWGLPGVRGAASPDRVARDIVRGLERNQRVVYTPSLWRWIMLGVRAVPDPLFRRMSF